MKKIVVVLLLLVATAAYAKHERTEAWYQDLFCPSINGQAEVVLEDRTRVDCVTVEYAIEVDFGPKWAEAIGQSLYYASQTGKLAGIILILEHPEDVRYTKRLKAAIDYHSLKIEVWEFKAWSMAK